LDGAPAVGAVHEHHEGAARADALQSEDELRGGETGGLGALTVYMGVR
jgi:hypothetical protein